MNNSLVLYCSLCQSAVALEIKTQWIQGGFILGKTDPKNSIEFLGHKVRVNAQGDFVVGLGRDAKQTVILTATTSLGVVHKHAFAVKQRQYREQRIEGVPKKTVDIPGEALPRIRQEVELTKAVLSSMTT